MVKVCVMHLVQDEGQDEESYCFAKLHVCKITQLNSFFTILHFVISDESERL